ncbi:DUF3617 family protein [Allosphingosinicella sp.]|jgi:hypothetical protein|uniref:DUF3617 domain-containing protein n=1 Tax=Allosphingosinicella sp. TaxID=2823234 RepID=UPI002F016F31
MKYRLLLGIAFLGVAACGGSNENQSANEVAAEMANVRLDHGEWEVETEIVSATGSGMPAEMLNAMRGQKQTQKTCITREQAENPDASFLAGQREEGCTYRNFAMRGGRITGSVTCRPPQGQGEGQVTMEMTGTYQPRNYDINMTMNMNMQLPGQGARQSMAIETRAKGRRLGDCPAGSASAPTGLGNELNGAGNSQ